MTSTAIQDSKRNRKPLKSLIAIAFWIMVWQVASMVVGTELILPSPLSTLRTLFILGRNLRFWLSAGHSLLRIIFGFVAGVVIGAILAILTSVSSVANTLLTPMIKVVRATPVASFIILVLLWVTRTLVPAFIAMLMVIPIVWGSLYTAIAETDKDLLEMAKAYNFAKLKTLRVIYIPSVLPAFTSGCLTAQGLAWKSGIAAEVLCLPSKSIGTELYYSKVYLETPSLFAWTAVVVLLSFLLEFICKFVLRKVVKQ